MNKLKSQKIDWLENSRSLNELSAWYFEVIKLEQVKKSSSRSSQIRTSEVEIRAFKHVAVLNFSWAQVVKKCVCVCVCPSVKSKLSYFPTLDFSETW